MLIVSFVGGFILGNLCGIGLLALCLITKEGENYYER